MAMQCSDQDQRVALEWAKELLLHTDLGNDEEELQELVAFGAACYMMGLQTWGRDCK